MDYKDAAWPVSRRVEDLLERMTAAEKIGQLIQPFGWKAYIKNDDGTIKLTEEFKSQLAEGGIGSLYGTLRADPWTGVTLANGLSPREGAEAVNAIQRYAMEHSRLGIPILFGEECSHGHMAIGATVFPVPLTIGSTWNTELFRSISRAVAAETRAQGEQPPIRRCWTWYGIPAGAVPKKPLARTPIWWPNLRLPPCRDCKESALIRIPACWLR